MSSEGMAAWIAAFGARLPTRRPLKIADVGSGTGRFTPALAEAFGGPVYGVEPAARMRAVAERDAAHPHVAYRPGRCESIPLGDDAVDAAILFGVWHHVDDKAEAAHELFRIVSGGGSLLVRTTSRDRFPELWWYEHFPRAREIDVAMAAPLASTVSTLGALFFGEVMQIPPCVLCWYQRICMFPLVLILPVGLFPLDRRVVRYALPLAAIGWLIAVFHVLLVAGVIPESLKPCTQGVPCSQQFITWFGFINIPLLAAIAFSTIIALLLAAHCRGSK